MNNRKLPDFLEVINFFSDLKEGVPSKRNKPSREGTAARRAEIADKETTVMWYLWIAVGVLAGIMVSTFVGFIWFQGYRFVNRKEWFQADAPWLANDDEMRQSLFWSLFAEQLQRAGDGKVGGRVSRRISFLLTIALGFSAWATFSLLRWIAKRNQPGFDRYFNPIKVALKKEERSARVDAA